MTKGQWLFGGVFVTASAVLLGAFAAAMTDSAHRDDVHEHEIDAGAPRDLAELLTWAPVVVIATLETERTTTTDLRSSTDGNVHGRRREYVRTFSVERVLKTDRAFGPEITVRAGITSSSWEDRESDAQTSDLLAPRLKKGSRYLLFLAVFDPENTGADLGHAGPLATAGLKGDVATFLVPPAIAMDHPPEFALKLWTVAQIEALIASPPALQPVSPRAAGDAAAVYGKRVTDLIERLPSAKAPGAADALLLELGLGPGSITDAAVCRKVEFIVEDQTGRRPDLKCAP